MFTKHEVVQALETSGLADVIRDLGTLSTTSAKIRYLTNLGWKRSRIAKMLGIKYQHVRNVELQPLKRVPGSTWSESDVNRFTELVHDIDNDVMPL